jgi:hypothetical protein
MEYIELRPVHFPGLYLVLRFQWWGGPDEIRLSTMLEF